MPLWCVLQSAAHEENYKSSDNFSHAIPERSSQAYQDVVKIFLEFVMELLIQVITKIQHVNQDLETTKRTKMETNLQSGSDEV
jgi:hypothetical protein